eukprot:3909334-Amphidinium_carterae.1
MQAWLNKYSKRTASQAVGFVGLRILCTIRCRFVSASTKLGAWKHATLSGSHSEKRTSERTAEIARNVTRTDGAALEPQTSSNAQLSVQMARRSIFGLTSQCALDIAARSSPSIERIKKQRACVFVILVVQFVNPRGSCFVQELQE